MGRFGITPVKVARLWGSLALVVIFLAACSGGAETTRDETTVERTGLTDSSSETTVVEGTAGEGTVGEETVEREESVEERSTRREASVAGDNPKEEGAKMSTGEPSPEARREVAGRMNLRDAVGQMFVVSMAGTAPDQYVEEMIRNRNIGGVLLFEYNMTSEAQTRRLTGSLQRLAMGTEPAVPLLVAVDQEGGEVEHVPWATHQPAATAIGRGGNAALARSATERMGRELRRAGINTDLAPVVDTGFGAAIGSRAYGEDPALVSEMGAAAVGGFEEAGVASAAKHFPNHGAAATDSHTALPVVNHDLATVRSYDLPPFRAAVEAGVPMVMLGHLVYPAIDPRRPASLSPAAVRLLREEVGFEGVIVTDDLGMAGASGGGSPARAAVAAVEAGVDLMLLSSGPRRQANAYDAVLEAVRSGEIPRGQIYESVERIREVKTRYVPQAANPAN